MQGESPSSGHNDASKIILCSPFATFCNVLGKNAFMVAVSNGDVELVRAMIEGKTLHNLETTEEEEEKYGNCLLNKHFYVTSLCIVVCNHCI